MQAERWKQVEALFEAAQQQPADQRAEFLRQACPDDPELCAEVESLLKAAESRDPLLDGSPLSSIAERPPALKPGDKLGNFEIVAMIGRGGMGEVYRARDPRLKRDVAIKTLPSGFAGDRDRIARFEREARAASALNHPNIVSVYDIGTDGGVSFIVSELVDGETLARLIQRGPLPLRKLIEVSTQICDGLAAAHTAGVIHRDLKPGNIYADPRRAREDPRFRAGAAGSRSRRRQHNDGGQPSGRDHGHSWLHVAGAGAGRTDRCALGPLQPGRDSV